jgi:hypothetical protein
VARIFAPLICGPQMDVRYFVLMGGHYSVPLRSRTIPLGIDAGSGRGAPRLGQGARNGISRKTVQRGPGPCGNGRSRPLSAKSGKVESHAAGVKAASTAASATFIRRAVLAVSSFMSCPRSSPREADKCPSSFESSSSRLGMVLFGFLVGQQLQQPIVPNLDTASAATEYAKASLPTPTVL